MTSPRVTRKSCGRLCKHGFANLTMRNICQPTSSSAFCTGASSSPLTGNETCPFDLPTVVPIVTFLMLLSVVGVGFSFARIWRSSSYQSMIRVVARRVRVASASRCAATGSMQFFGAEIAPAVLEGTLSSLRRAMARGIRLWEFSARRPRGTVPEPRSAISPSAIWSLRACVRRARREVFRAV